jgi:hypothetical protein
VQEHLEDGLAVALVESGRLLDIPVLSRQIGHQGEFLWHEEKEKEKKKEKEKEKGKT